MSNLEAKLDSLIIKLKKNLQDLMAAKEIRLSQIRPSKSPGVYMLFFEGELQYIGSSGNLNRRIRANLLGGNRESHTLINKLCVLRNWSRTETLNFLKMNSTLKVVETDSEEDAKILENVLIPIHHPFFNVPLRKLKKK